MKTKENIKNLKFIRIIQKESVSENELLFTVASIILDELLHTINTKNNNRKTKRSPGSQSNV
jgi:hypothetical protein